MPTPLTHTAIPLVIAVGLGSRIIPPRLLVAGMIAAILPDIDVIGHRFGISRGGILSHRGLTHSFLFALLPGLLAAFVARRLGSSWQKAFLFVTGCTLSHGLLDTFTNSGMGVALLWPWSDARWFAPWQVIEASPLHLRRLMSYRGVEVFTSELRWVWLPASLACIGLFVARRHAERVSTTRQSAQGMT